AVADGATVPIYYESRLARLDLRADEVPRIDEAFEEATEGEEVSRVESLKTRWAQLEAVVGTDRRLELVARDLVDHFMQRQGAMLGKAMVVVMSRRIAVDLYREIAKLRPDWHAEEDSEGAIKVVMTGSASDPLDWQQHIRSKSRRAALADRFKLPDDPFRMVIVRDMWLTGFDAPSLHTMYVDKPMRGHGLMQAIARVNRVFRDKPGGLVVDYIGIADDLRKALSVYAQSGVAETPVVDQDQAVRAMRERFEVCRDLFHGFDYSAGLSGTPAERMALLPAAQNHILGLDEGRHRFTSAVTDLSKAFALSVPRDEAIAIRDEVALFQAVKAALMKSEAGRHRPPAELDHAIRQIVAGAVAPGEVVDIFAAAGLPKPDIGLLSDEFLADVRRMPHRNLAVELLRKLLHDEIRHRSRRNLVEARSFSEMLEATVRRYQNRAIETAQVIEELIALAKSMQAARARGEELGLTDDELAFYDALETNDSAVAVMGDDVLREIARELTDTVRRNATIDWTLKESVRARLRAMVRRILRRHGYPPDKQEQATKTVLAQAEQLGLDFAEAPALVVPGPDRLIVPFMRVAPSDLIPFENAVPLYTLEAAAGGFGEDQMPEPEDWVLPSGTAPGPGLFVARVIGESMNRRIPSGAYCLFRHPVEGSRDGRVLLVEQESITDPDHGGRYTVKVYSSHREELDDGTWRHVEIRLEPDTDAPGYAPIILTEMPEDAVRVVAELVEVLPG
ncbi:MAG: type I restriction enzyme endonuclease domain-containing protein, partial [Candidatus Limnocylindria bacterium]